MFFPKIFKLVVGSIVVAGILIWSMLFFHLEKNKSGYIYKFILFLRGIPVDLKLILIFIILFYVYIISRYFTPRSPRL
jgi:hypothetical protein